MRLAISVLVAAAVLVPAAAQAQSQPVRYEITGRTTLVATPTARGRTVAPIDSGTIITVDWAEESRPTHTRVTYNGQEGWIANTALRRIVTVRDTVQVRVVDTVTVTRVDTVVRVDTVRLSKKP